MAPALTIEHPDCITGYEARLASRTGTLTTPTCGHAPGYLQANLIILPSQYAHDFELLCTRNPVPCPLLAKSATPGDFTTLTSCLSSIPSTSIASDLDIRTDAPFYNIYHNGKLTKTSVPDLKDHWDKQDHVAFLIGCSYSFETALCAAGLPPPHLTHSHNVSMYRSNIPLNPAGLFTNSTYVVSMRMYPASSLSAVRSTTRPYVATHGEPVAWGWEGAKAIGITDVNRVDWGDAPVLPNGEKVVHGEGEWIPVFWGCGVTPQEAVMKAKIPGTVMGHQPGYMLVLDVREEDILTHKAK